MKYVIGLARSHPKVLPACFHACHILQKCGFYFTDSEDRRQTIRFLDDFAQRSRGPMIGRVRDQLEQQWKSN
jgi:hypothetical protein